jgi:MFS superfamily sulfate permease-like transporter
MFSIYGYGFSAGIVNIDSSEQKIYFSKKSDEASKYSPTGGIFTLLIGFLIMMVIVVCAVLIPVTHKTNVLNLEIGVPLGIIWALIVMMRRAYYHSSNMQNKKLITDATVPTFISQKKFLDNIRKKLIRGYIVLIGVYLYTIYLYVWGSYKEPTDTGIGYTNGNIYIIVFTAISVFMFLAANPIRIIRTLGVIEKYKNLEHNRN